MFRQFPVSQSGMIYLKEWLAEAMPAAARQEGMSLANSQTDPRIGYRFGCSNRIGGCRGSTGRDSSQPEEQMDIPSQ